jgi:pilus assembly protein Flp/PilA
MTGRFVQVVVGFLKREDGPTSVEYVVLLALIIVVLITVSNIGNTTNSTYANPQLQAATKPSGS